MGAAGGVGSVADHIAATTVTQDVAHLLVVEACEAVALGSGGQAALGIDGKQEGGVGGVAQRAPLSAGIGQPLGRVFWAVLALDPG
jgi:hypothetical protein